MLVKLSIARVAIMNQTFISLIFFYLSQIIDEKSLIKKYQKEISILKQELDQVKRGILPGITQEEIMSLRQQVLIQILS